MITFPIKNKGKKLTPSDLSLPILFDKFDKQYDCLLEKLGLSKEVTLFTVKNDNKKATKTNKQA